MEDEDEGIQLSTESADLNNELHTVFDRDAAKYKIFGFWRANDFVNVVAICRLFLNFNFLLFGSYFLLTMDPLNGNWYPYVVLCAVCLPDIVVSCLLFYAYRNKNHVLFLPFIYVTNSTTIIFIAAFFCFIIYGPIFICGILFSVGLLNICSIMVAWRSYNYLKRRKVAIQMHEILMKYRHASNEHEGPSIEATYPPPSYAEVVRDDEVRLFMQSASAHVS